MGKYSPGYLSRFSSTLQSLITDQSTNQTKAMNGRIEVFHSALYHIKNHFFIGNGFGYRERMPSYLMTHNWLLEYLITGGIISFLLKIFIFILQFLKLVTVKNNALKQGLIISFVFVLIQGLVEPSFGSPLFELIFALIIGFGTNTLYEEKNFMINLLTQIFKLYLFKKMEIT
ncbi:O-antigen ligase family protein [Streptococcus parauberis]|nr:O-antigen ligase family protein [Streptococcus parauberis]WEM66152.1 O-antigen ligase family protein [Streptococcus parauberis]